MPQRVVVENALYRWRRAEATMNAAAGLADWRAAVTEERLANIAYQDAVGSARPAPRSDTADRDVPLRREVAEPGLSVGDELRLGHVMIGSGGLALSAIK